ncbi:hypothetical protein B0H13DRAFT_2333500 [Mycena leptocephala]|nr:hypothetical protein B0H13DRAFT_2333500 [Mycena leptocephala]
MLGVRNYITHSHCICPHIDIAAFWSPACSPAPELLRCVSPSFCRRRPRNPCASNLSFSPTIDVHRRRRAFHLPDRSMPTAVDMPGAFFALVSYILASARAPSRLCAYPVVFARQNIC